MLEISSATMLGVRRLLHSVPGDPPFGTYETFEKEDGKFQSKLVLTDDTRIAAGLKQREYTGEKCSTKPEAEQAASRAFWDDSLVKERAAKLEPSKKAQRNVGRCAKANAKRKALYGYGTGVSRIIRDDRKAAAKRRLSGHRVAFGFLPTETMI